MIYQIGMTRVMVNNFQEVSETSHLSSGLSRNRISMLALMTSLCMLPPKYDALSRNRTMTKFQSLGGVKFAGDSGCFVASSSYVR